jgi:uncharacterized membrane protein YfhO
VYIDGKESNYIKTDYILRGMEIPAGKHNIEFIFAPAIYFTSDTITFWGCVILYLVIIAAAAKYFINVAKRE